jgi:L-rhamnose-H+ transport protein
MNTLFGLLFIAIGSVGQASSYVPINKIKSWSWESFWLVQGIFAWVLFPFVGAWFSLPGGHSLGELYAASAGVWGSIGFGALWGIGGLMLGLGMRYLGVSLGQSLTLGTCSAFGTIMPVLLKGDSLFAGKGLILLLGVCIGIAGIATIAYAGALKSKNMTEEEKKRAVKDFALKKGLLIAFVAGIMAACFNLGLESGAPIKAQLLEWGTKDLLVLNPVILLVALGGFITNAVYCLFQNYRNKTFNDYTKVSLSTGINNLLFCALAGILWYIHVLGLGIGQSFFDPSGVMMAFSWSILMSLDVLFSNIWGIILKEWKGVHKTTIVVLVVGLILLILSVFFPQLMQFIVT